MIGVGRLFFGLAGFSWLGVLLLCSDHPLKMGRKEKLSCDDCGRYCLSAAFLFGQFTASIYNATIAGNVAS
jgi:hypothetical protein